MNVSELEQTSDPSRKGRGVLCAKCEHLNAPGRGTCSRCGGHLYVSCHDCGARNERIRSRCTSCGRRMHRSFMEKYFRRVSKNTRHVTPLQVVLFIVALGIVFAVIVFAGSFSLPNLW